jgi:hypothetical protein
VIFVAVLVALAAFLIIGTRLSNAGRLSVSLQSLRSRSVTVHVWGAALPGDGNATYRVDSVRALGAGLLIFLRQSPNGTSTLLKIAQPRASRIEAPLLEVGHAAYVQWEGRRLPRVEGVPALRIQIQD